MHFLFSVTLQNRKTGERFPIYAHGSAVARDKDKSIVNDGGGKAVRAFNRVAKNFRRTSGIVSNTFRRLGLDPVTNS